MLGSFGKLMIIIGFLLVAAGVALMIWGRIPWLGHLPGDISIVRDNMTIYLPITTSLLLSIFISFLYHIFTRR